MSKSVVLPAAVASAHVALRVVYIELLHQCSPRRDDPSAIADGRRELADALRDPTWLVDPTPNNCMDENTAFFVDCAYFKLRGDGRQASVSHVIGWHEHVAGSRGSWLPFESFVACQLAGVPPHEVIGR